MPVPLPDEVRRGHARGPKAPYPFAMRDQLMGTLPPSESLYLVVVFEGKMKTLWRRVPRGSGSREDGPLRILLVPLRILLLG